MCLVTQSCPTLCDLMDCSPPGSSVYGDAPGKHTGVACHTVLRGIFPTQGLNPGLPHCRQSLPAELRGKPILALQPPILSCFSTAQPRACKLHFPAWLSTWLPGTGRSLAEASPSPHPSVPWTWLCFCRGGAVMAGEAGVPRARTGSWVLPTQP